MPVYMAKGNLCRVDARAPQPQPLVHYASPLAQSFRLLEGNES